MKVDEQCITIKFPLSGTTNFQFLTFVYMSVSYRRRRHLWSVLLSLGLDSSPWLIIGDFNAILGAHEKVVCLT